MPFTKTRFTLPIENLQEAIDVDDSAGRSVPVNMNFVEEGFLSKDTGSLITGLPETKAAHSLFLYKKKNGTNYLIRALGTKLQRFSFPDRAWYDIPGSPTFTEGAEFGFYVYNDELWGGNAVEDSFKFDGATFTSYPTMPKGNNFEVFEDRLFVSGVLAEPLSLYYSDVGVPQTFQTASVVKPLGTDAISGQKNYYGTLLIFKTASIWKLTFQFDQILADFIPKLEIQSANYGACSRKAVTPVENDLWFFTGREVRAIGFQDNQIGVFGVNSAVISNSIKDTLATIPPARFGAVVTFYFNRRYYLGVPLASDDVDTLFVCHLLYARAWTKYVGRDKAHANDFAVVDNVVYTTFTGDSYGVIKWTVTAEDAAATQLYLVTE